MPQLRLHISAAVAVGALMLLTASPASADTPPPRGPASLLLPWSEVFEW